MHYFDPKWNNKTLDYDLQTHDWPTFWLNVAKEKFPQIETLETIHKVLTPIQISELGRHLQFACDRPEFMDRVDAFYSQYVPDLIDDNDWMVQRFFTIRMVIPNQAKEGRLLAFHQGVWVGNGLGLRTIWTPFTKCYESNSMQMLERNTSERITYDSIKEDWNYDTLQQECVKHCWPVTLEPGQSHLFDQTIVHGNINNETDITRWSMDGRILIKGGDYHRKLPGGYFRFPGERPDERLIDTNKVWISYAGWNSKWSKELPLPMQRRVINDYCEKHSIKINDYQFENEYFDLMPGLEQYIGLEKVDGIVLCSIYCLPDNPFKRHELLQKALDCNVELHFANELCSLRDEKDLEHIKRIFGFVHDNVPPNEVLGFKK
jgi:sporadic carbohydrate cluster protein (TIGR04323 family)